LKKNLSSTDWHRLDTNADRFLKKVAAFQEKNERGANLRENEERPLRQTPEGQGLTKNGRPKSDSA
jgi:hypothetical protein